MSIGPQDNLSVNRRGGGGLDGTLRDIGDGNNNVSALKLSTSAAQVAGDLTVTGTTTAEGALNVGGAVDLTGALAATDVNTSGDVTVGGDLEVAGDTALVDVELTGNLTLADSATVWDDLRVPITSTKLGGSNDPDFSAFRTNGAGSQGVFAFLFDKNVEQELYFSVQLPHTWKEGSDIVAHVHWCPVSTGGGNVVWGLEYTWSNINGTFGNTTLATVTAAAGTTAYKHLLDAWTDLSGTGKTHSSMIMCRVYRKAADAADTLDADAALLEVDFHYEINSLGEATRPGS